jgi:hypothetical protein
MTTIHAAAPIIPETFFIPAPVGLLGLATIRRSHFFTITLLWLVLLHSGCYPRQISPLGSNLPDKNSPPEKFTVDKEMEG